MYLFPMSSNASYSRDSAYLAYFTAVCAVMLERYDWEEKVLMYAQTTSS